jgi:hypothetical protein
VIDPRDYEGAFATGTGAVDGLSDKFFTCAGFAGYQDRCVGRRNLFDKTQGFAHRRRHRDNGRVPVLAGQLFAQSLIVGTQTALFGSLAY